jgi:Fe2+ or Zn2+ uptake regulation protein
VTGRRTPQLTAVEAVVRAAHDHPSAEEVYRRVRKTLPQVSLGTVYRNLQKLAADQRLRVVKIAGRGARYDGMLETHDHFLCDACSSVADVVAPRRAGTPTSRELHRAGYRVRAQTVTLYGLCPECCQRQGAADAPAGRG